MFEKMVSDTRIPLSPVSLNAKIKITKQEQAKLKKLLQFFNKVKSKPLKKIANNESRKMV